MRREETYGNTAQKEFDQMTGDYTKHIAVGEEASSSHFQS